MRRSQLHPELLGVLRGVERDIHERSVVAIVRCGYTEQDARDYLRRRDAEVFRESVQVVFKQVRDAFQVFGDAAAESARVVAEVLAPLRGERQ